MTRNIRPAHIVLRALQKNATLRSPMRHMDQICHLLQIQKADQKLM